MKYHRLKTRDDFRGVMKTGKRSSGQYMTLYITKNQTCNNLAGFILSKAVGGAVIRNLYKRRLSAIAREIDGSQDFYISLVVRAKPNMAEANFQELKKDFEGLFIRVFSQL